MNLIIFGVNRCPEICLPSLERFFSELPGCVDIYVGLILLDEEVVDTNNEQKIFKLSFDKLKKASLLRNIKAFQVFSQTNPSRYGNVEVLSSSLDKCMKRLDIFYNDYASIRNYMNYLYYASCFSCHLSNQMKDRPTLLLRPDMIYEGFCLERIQSIIKSINLEPRLAFVLAHDSFGFVNDRFIMSNTQVVLSYMRRQADLGRYLLWPWRYFHSEKYASWFLRRRLGLRIIELPSTFVGKRVRSNGCILDDCNPVNYRSRKFQYSKLFVTHSFWQLKLSLKSFIKMLISS